MVCAAIPMASLEDVQDMLGPSKHLQRTTSGGRSISATVPSLRQALSREHSVSAGDSSPVGSLLVMQVGRLGMLGHTTPLCLLKGLAFKGART